MKRGSKLTELECTLLAHLKKRPRTGYELCQVLEGLPMGTFSSSPGSVYPALRRLQEAGLVKSIQAGVGRRPRAECHLTPGGIQKLAAWLDAPVTVDDLLRRPGGLALKFAFLESPDRRTAFVDGYAAAAKTGLDHYVRFLEQAGDRAAGGSIGALELVRDLLASHLHWALRERKKPEVRSSQGS